MSDNIQGKQPPQHLTIKAPIDGEITPLSQVPDPIFSEQIIGDGLSIQPTSPNLCAPCDGQINTIFNYDQAFTMTSADDLSLLIHVGVDTADLEGQGFKRKKAPGDNVVTGEVIIELDLNFIAAHSTSLLTSVVITNRELNYQIKGAQGSVIAGQSVLFDVIINPEPPKVQRLLL